MRPKLNGRKEIITSYIQQYYLENDRIPSERDIASGTGIPTASVHRFLVEMRDNGEISYDGRRSARTEDMEHVSPKLIIPVLGYVACGPGEEKEQQFLEYIHVSESMVGSGDFFALIAKGKSMVDAGVQPGDYVIVRKQRSAKNGDIVVAVLNGKYNLKKLVYENGSCILHSCNPSMESNPDTMQKDGQEICIQGVAAGVYHRF